MAENTTASQSPQWTMVSLSPDVCKTPRGDSTPPIPYPVTAQLLQAVLPVPTVRTNNTPLVVMDQSFAPMTQGDEPGVAGGIKSGTVGSICEPLEHSASVTAGGFPILRNGDICWMNNKNTPGVICGQPAIPQVPVTGANPPVVPETAKEKGFLEMLGESYVQEAESRRAATQKIKDVVSDFVTDDTPDGVMNSELIAAMLHAGDIYSRVPGASDAAIQQMGGEAAETWKTLNTDQVKGSELVIGSLLGGALLARNGPQMAVEEAGAATRSAETAAAAAKTTNAVEDAGAAASTAVKTPNAPGGQFPVQGETPKNNKANSQCTRNCSTPGEPVDIVTGDFLQHLSVLSLPGTLPLSLSRFHRTSSQVCGLFGPKWMDEWSRFLELDAKTIRFTDHEGVTLVYSLPHDGQLRNAVNSHMGHYVLSGDIHNQLTVFDRQARQTLIFGEINGTIRRLSAICDGYGNTISFVYQQGQLTCVRHSDGYELTLSSLNGRVTAIDLYSQGKIQRLVTCQYDDQGMLAECDTFQFSHKGYTWSPENRMLHWWDADGTQVDLFYDAQGRVTETRTPEGYFNDRFTYDDAERKSRYHDAEGGVTTYWYNDDGLVVREADPLGRETLTEWAHSKRQSQTDALGRTTTWQYNLYGDITRLSLPGGIMLHYEYDAHGNLTRFQGPGNKIWQFTYDEHGGLREMTDPQGRQRHWHYGDHGEVLRQVLPDGETWHYGYDPLHRLNCIADPAQGEIRLEQDMLGRLLTVSDPLQQKTTYRHSNQHASLSGSVTHLTLPDGVEQQYDHSSGKQVASFTDGEGKTTHYEYGSFGLLKTLTRPDGQCYRFIYDGLTRLKQVINAAGERWTYTLDAAGQLISETDFSGRTLHYEYDAAGRRTATHYPDNNIIREYYDSGDRLLQRQVRQRREEAEQIISTTDFRYDAEFRLISACTPDSRVEFEYDTDGQVIAETLNGRRVARRYDPLSGRPVAWQLDDVAVQFTHGVMGRMTHWQINDHPPLQFSHDALGREIKRHSEAGFQHGQSYSPVGNIVEQWAGHHEPGTTDWPMDIWRRQEYDRAWNLTCIRDSRWGTTTYRHDSNDQITLAEGGTRQLPRQERFDYDINLNIRHHGQTRNLPDALMQFTAQEQEHGRVTKRGNNRYRYDEGGRLVEKTVLSDGFRPQRWRYRWDGMGQLIQLITPQGERWHYTYDAFGRRLSKRRERATLGIAGYDYQWSGDLLVAETPVYADGTAAVESSVYWLYEPGALTPGARYENGQLHYVVRDHMGTPRELLTETGEVVRAQKLSVWGKAEQYRFGGLSAANDDDTAPHCPWRFAGQYADEESRLHYNRFRYYDAETGQYVSPDPIGLLGGLNLYQYAPNPLTWIDPLGLTTGTTAGGMSRTTPTWRDRYGPASMRDHHLIPQAMMNDPVFMAQMKNAGISNPTDYIHRQISKIPNAQHSEIHGAGWNEKWKDWFKQNPDFNKSDLQSNIKNMMEQHNIPGSSRNFAKRYGCKGG